MLEGLAIWALFIYILRLLGVPWKTPFKLFAYIGGGLWLGFVWIGLINYTPMDMSGGSVVQSPHIQLRPGSTQIKGKVAKIHIEPNSQVEKGQLIYELEDDVYRIELEKSVANVRSAEIAHLIAVENAEAVKVQKQSLALGRKIATSNLMSAEDELKLLTKMLERYRAQNAVVKHTITDSMLDEQETKMTMAQNRVLSLRNEVLRSGVALTNADIEIERAKLDIDNKLALLKTSQEKQAKAQWDLEQTKVYAPADGFVTNFVLREGQYVGVLSRMQMFTNEKYVLMRVNHQAIRNVKVGQHAEFVSPVYPGKVFSAEVQGIVEATGESQADTMGREASVSQTTLRNVQNKYHFVRLKLNEPQDYDIPVGAVGLAWVSGEKPNHFLSFLDAIRGIIIRMKSQIYYVYSI
ncbi:efflux RND transporter periplasmic adaptor subunit [uncultured Vibrio sp.]|uniref:HlyD family secretion protein n=1 Tax=uncultured Vibrio sp. TaxID=114054 RepID=UPI0025D2702B|nr:efflux RND transporter periplasmic adaptor subunit [uncultured Vibrio sp.]